MDTDMEPLSDEIMWSGINNSVELKKSGVDMNLFQEDYVVSCELSSLQTVPEGNINAVFSDLSVPQDIPQDIQNHYASPKYHNLRNVNTLDWHQEFPLQDLPSHEFFSQDPGFASPHNGSAPGSFQTDIDWESAPTEEFGPIYPDVPLNEIDELPQQFDVSLVAKRVDPALFDNYQPQEPVQPVSFGKIKVVAPPARYNKKRVVAEKKAPAPISRRGRGTKDGQRSSVQRHRDNIKNFLETAPALIDELTTVEATMQERVRELEHILYHELYNMLNKHNMHYTVPQWNYTVPQ